MRIVQLNNSIPRMYKNNGQHAEQVARFTYTGKIVKADSTPFTASADILDIQVKSARATVCKGLDIRAHVAIDAAKCYGYVIADCSKMYIMTPNEWIEFVDSFATATVDSSKERNPILKLPHENKDVKRWLEKASGVNR